jgi:TPR repeat protein
MEKNETDHSLAPSRYMQRYSDDLSSSRWSSSCVISMFHLFGETPFDFARDDGGLHHKIWFSEEKKEDIIHYAVNMLPSLQAEADAGNSLAMQILGDFYEQGIAVHESAVKAASWYEAGAYCGNGACMAKIGQYLIVGRGIPKDCQKGFLWLLAGAEACDPLASFWAGVCSFMGTGTSVNYKTAAEYFRKCDCAEAMENIAVCYENGLSGNEDGKAASLWHENAREKHLESIRRKKKDFSR